MPQYQIFYLKDSEIERFRQTAPKEERYQLLLRHYEEAGQIEARGTYAAWSELRETGAEQRGIRPMGVGDVLVPDGERPLLCHFWGFEEAEWRQPAENAGSESQSADESSGSLVSSGTVKG